MYRRVSVTLDKKADPAILFRAFMKVMIEPLRRICGRDPGVDASLHSDPWVPPSSSPEIGVHGH